LASKLVTYSTGRSPQPFDKFELDAVVHKVQAKGLGFRTLIHEVIQSPLFLRK
jgi:hypothetical protein